MQTKNEKLPKSAISLYVKLYCKRKGGTNTKCRNNLIEATKSWVSLSEDEKQQFAAMLEECRRKFKNRFADYLKNAEPYLRKKRSTRISQPNVEEDILLEKSFDSSQNYEENHQNDNFRKEISNGTVAEGQWTENTMDSDLPENIQQPHTEPLPEPVPPCVKSAKELFKVVKAMDGNDHKSWQDLTQKQKYRYRMAVLTLKKEYIAKYKDYLESLPSKQLFDYYNTKSVP